MSGDRYFIDTNIVLFLLGGDETIADILDKKKIYFSFITEIELLSYEKLENSDIKNIRGLISDCTVIDLTEKIKNEAIRIRKKYKLKLPDCIIAATAISLKIPLLSADNDFKKIEELAMVYYDTV